MKRLLGAAAVGLALVLILPALTQPVVAQDPVVRQGPVSKLTVTTGSGVYPFEVEVADDPAERAQGLMYRRHMDPGHGMLFDMRTTAEAAFWMENTYISLDIAFIGEDGKVVSVARETTPLSKALIPSRGEIRFVLELVAGTAEKIGLQRGDRVHHPVIDAFAGTE